MLNESWIRELADRYGLTVEKRVTTGNSRCGFATFELTGSQDRVSAAWPTVHDIGRGPTFEYMRTSDADGALYIALESVWFDTAPAPSV